MTTYTEIHEALTTAADFWNRGDLDRAEAEVTWAEENIHDAGFDSADQEIKAHKYLRVLTDLLEGETDGVAPDYDTFGI